MVIGARKLYEYPAAFKCPKCGSNDCEITNKQAVVENSGVFAVGEMKWFKCRNCKSEGQAQIHREKGRPAAPPPGA